MSDRVHDLPSGTVTFLFTDVEGSTRLLERHPRAYPEALALHGRILADAVAAAGGTVFAYALSGLGGAALAEGDARRGVLLLAAA
ncbi:MAG: hypothetical protein M3O91_07340 [Chloroflexota bacterium]|nr:hypothetical protein [Chloroflexota bacterium]